MMKLSVLVIILGMSLSAFAELLPIINYPFHPLTEVYCDQGTNSPSGNSHSSEWGNTKHALDLHTPQKQSPATIFASSSGRVVSYSECKVDNTDCGNGFGNFVKIIRGDNVMIMYAHLNKVFVKTGQHVRIGQEIGFEGMTGQAGENNRHLHMSVHFDGQRSKYEASAKNPFLTPESIPFKMNICQPSYGTCSQQYNDIRKVKCHRARNSFERVYSYY